jgi:hypothetical protein
MRAELGPFNYGDYMSSVQPTLLRVQLTDKGVEFSFVGVYDGDIASLIGHFLLSRGFALGSGSPIAGVYETGSAVSRALVGGLVKRQKYSVNIWTDATATHAIVCSEMSGASGSVLGVVRERKGRDEIKNGLQWHVQSVFAGGFVAHRQASQPYHSPQMPSPTTRPDAAVMRTLKPTAIPQTESQSLPTPSNTPDVHQRAMGSVSVELARLAGLHREGRLTDAELEAAQRQLLGR